MKMKKGSLVAAFTIVSLALSAPMMANEPGTAGGAPADTKEAAAKKEAKKPTDAGKKGNKDHKVQGGN